MRTTFFIFLLVCCIGCSGILKKYEKFDVELSLRPTSFIFIDSLQGLIGQGWRGDVFTTEDGGKHWKICASLNSVLKQLVYKQGRVYACIEFYNNEPEEVFVSDNLGKDWRLLFKCDTIKYNLLDFHVQDSLNLYRSIRADSGRVDWQYSKDGGKTWHWDPRLNYPSSSWKFDSDTLLYRYEINVKDKGKIVRYFTRNLKTGENHLYRLPQNYKFTRFFSNNFVLAETRASETGEDSVTLFRLEKGKCIRHSSLPEKLKRFSSVDYFFNDGIRFCILVTGLGSRDCIFISNDRGKNWQEEKLGNIGYYTIYSEPDKMKVWYYTTGWGAGKMKVFEF